MKLIDIQQALEDWSPLTNAEDFDNVGLLVGDSNAKINKGLITLDTTDEIIDEAINLDCNLIITFHPFLYKGHENLKSEEPRTFSRLMICQTKGEPPRYFGNKLL